MSSEFFNPKDCPKIEQTQQCVTVHHKGFQFNFIVTKEQNNNSNPFNRNSYLYYAFNEALNFAKTLQQKIKYLDFTDVGF
jgi:hypothetical protein